MKTNDNKIFGWWFEVMTTGTVDKVALYWYAEPSVLTHRSWCGDYTHTHARNTHTHTRTHACTHQYTTRPTHTLKLKCSTYTCMRTHQALTDTYTTR